MGYLPVGWADVDRLTISELTVVPYGDDVKGWVLAVSGGRFVLPSGPVLPEENPLLDTVLRVPLEVAGFRRQATFPFAVDGERLAVWVSGGRYRGGRAHANVPWWQGDAGAAAELLAGQGDQEQAELMRLAEQARATLSDEEFYLAMTGLLEPAYLAAGTPQGGSGFGGDADEWRSARSIVAEVFEADGTFLDVGCANGHLMASVVGWAAERGITVEPYGVDLAGGLVDAARSRLPRWADRIWQGNALTWTPPDGLRFDVVHTLLDCVPGHAVRGMLQHLLDTAVAPGGKLLASSYVDAVHTHLHAATLLRDYGFEVAGETRAPIRTDGRIQAPSAWIRKAG
ncbi:class I SAM-dependent methyltransferase [Flindersiella endophytica]